MYITIKCKECGGKFVRAYQTDFCSMKCAKEYTFKLADDPERTHRMFVSAGLQKPMQLNSDGESYHD